MSTAPRIEAAKRDWGHDETGCTILHIDMDAFFASVEIARHPELKGKPVIIGDGPRAVVSAASYEARRYGVNSAMPAARAHQLCPDGIFLPVDGRYYHEVSRRIVNEVFLTITDQFEQVSVDEGYMDVAAALLKWGKPSAIGAWIRAEVARRFNVTCSVGIGCNKLIAKMASTNAKPDGMLLIPKARSAEFVQMMPLRGIPGIGPSLERRLNEWGINSVAELATMDEETLARATGSTTAAHGLWQASHGLDSRRIVTEREEKSIGSEETLAEDTRDMRVVAQLLRTASNDVARSLRRRGLVARTITVKLRFADLKYQTRSHTLEQPVDTASAIYPQSVRQLKAMLGMDENANEHTELPRLVRLAGVSVSSLSPANTTAVQTSLDEFLDEPTQQSTPSKMQDAERALDAVRKKFGGNAASLGM